VSRTSTGPISQIATKILAAMSARAAAVRLEEEHSLSPNRMGRTMQLFSMVSDIDGLRLTARWIVLRVFPPRVPH